MNYRIQKILSSYGIASRRNSEKLICSGKVTVNGKTAVLGDSADPEVDVIKVDGIRLLKAPNHIYIMLNKPKGYVTTVSDEKGRKNVCELVCDCKQRVYPIGRLDMNSEGLLLLTNDGDFANRLMHPRHEINKTYLTWVNNFSEEKLLLLSKMKCLGTEQISSPRIRLIQAKGESALIELVIHEGKNRQIRRMCEQVELHVTRLKRIAEGSVQLGGLPTGSWRFLTDEEIESLKTN